MMFANITWWSVVYGLATALDTLCSQAFTGAMSVTTVGVHLQTGILVMGIFVVPVSLVWWNGEYLLLALGQDPQLAALSGIYLRYLIPSIVPGFLFECLKRYLQAQGDNCHMFRTTPVFLHGLIPCVTQVSCMQALTFC